MHEIADFLREYEPFATLEPAALEGLAGSVEIEYFPAGDLIFAQNDQPAQRVRMVVTGAIELSDGDRALDLLGPGELFGHPSMLAGLPTGLAARAHEDTICYGLPAELMLPLLARPEALRYVARSLLSRRWRVIAPSTEQLVSDPARRPVSTMTREPVVISEPATSVREVARAMAAQGASCAVISLPDGGMGIVTDRDLRVRVVAGEVGLDAPVELAMSSPAFTVLGSRPGADVMIEMINRGIRHVPVVSPRNELIGVVTDIDLLASDTRTPFMMRRRIARARDLADLVAAVSQDLRPTVIALHEAQVSATQLSAIIAAFADAITRRALELLVSQAPDLPRFEWLATGSMGRREAFASSDVDCALSWQEPADPERMRALARRVLELLADCRFVTDEHAATAAHPLFARSVADWHESISRYFDHPEDSRLPIVISVVADAHPLYANGQVADAFTELRQAYRHPIFMGTLREMALAHKPPTGFLRDIVVEHSGEHRGLLDIKRGGFLPIVGLARYLALITGTAATATIDRLRAAAAAGAIPASDATDLIEAFELFGGLRMDHQIRQLQAGEEPTDYLDPTELSPLTRRYLREAFRAIAGVQRRIPELQ